MSSSSASMDKIDFFTHRKTADQCTLSTKHVKKNASSIIMLIPGSLFDIVRNLCFQLNSEEDQLTEEISTMAIKNLTLAIKLMHTHPSLCYKDNENSELADHEYQHHDEDDEM